MYTNTTVRQILDRKGYNVWSLEPDVTVLEALAFMAKKNIGAVIVISEGKPVGIFSERDYARKVALNGKRELDTLLEEVMTRQVIGVGLDYKIEMCLALMSSKFVRHLPVVNAEYKIVGVISIGDVVKELAEEQKFVIEQLVDYISGEQKKPAIPEPAAVRFP